jgi:hypothetical protein
VDELEESPGFHPGHVRVRGPSALPDTSFRRRPIWQGRRLLTVQVPVRARAPEQRNKHQARIAQRQSAAFTRRMPQVQILVRVPRGRADVGESGPVVTRLLTQGSSNLSARTRFTAACPSGEGPACKAGVRRFESGCGLVVPSTVELRIIRYGSTCILVA